MCIQPESYRSGAPCTNKSPIWCFTRLTDLQKAPGPWNKSKKVCFSTENSSRERIKYRENDHQPGFGGEGYVCFHISWLFS